MRWLIALMVLAVTSTAAKGQQDLDIQNAELDVKARESDYEVARIQVKVAEVETDYHRKRYERVRNLAKTGAVGEEEVAKAEVEYTLAKLSVDMRRALATRANVELERAKLRLASLRAGKKKSATPAKTL